MKRILQVIGQLGRGGDTSVVLEIDRLLNDTDYRFDYLTHNRADMKLVKCLRESGHKVFVLDGDVRKLGIVKYYNEIKNILTQTKGEYYAIHVHTSLQSGIVLYAAHRAGIKRRICHSHTNAIQQNTNFILKTIGTPILRYACNRYSTLNVGCSNMAGDFLFGNGNYVTIYNGIDTSKYSEITDEEKRKLCCDLGIKESTYIVGHVAHFGDLKNQLFDIELARVLKPYDNIVFVLVGNKAHNYEMIKDKVEKEELNVVFTGQRDDVPKLMNLFDCVILPSLPGEGFPVVLLEAQAAGCQCIISENITKEVDIGLNLMSMISLNNIDEWIKKIQFSRKKTVDGRQYAKLVCEKGFGKNDFFNNWIKLYEGVQFSKND